MAPFDTDWPADSIEFCPTPGLQNVFVCGTYKLDQPEEMADEEGDGEASAPKRQHRRGKCLVFSADDHIGDGL
jgi:diphthamide biosynthesis protein 7